MFIIFFSFISLLSIITEACIGNPTSSVTTSSSSGSSAASASSASSSSSSAAATSAAAGSGSGATSTATTCSCTLPLAVGDRGVAAEIQHQPFAWATTAADPRRFRFVDIGISRGQSLGLAPPGITNLLTNIKSAGLLSQPHHFAEPGLTDGATQARFFDANGGHFTCDGLSMPGALLIQEPIGTPVGTCPALSGPALIQWISDFYTTYRSLNSGCGPIIYTDMVFWQNCVASTNTFSNQFNANLQVANTDDPQLAGLTTLPASKFQPFGWARYAIWANERATNVGGITGSYSSPSSVLGLIYNGYQ